MEFAAGVTGIVVSDRALEAEGNSVEPPVVRDVAGEIDEPVGDALGAGSAWSVEQRRQVVPDHGSARAGWYDRHFVRLGCFQKLTADIARFVADAAVEAGLPATTSVDQRDDVAERFEHVLCAGAISGTERSH